MALRVDVVFDVAESSPYFAPTINAIEHAVAATKVAAEVCVVRTNTIGDAYFDDLPDAVVMGPGTPYRSPEAAELVITSARERGLPLVGT